jgi:hypothetical protein
MSAEATQATDVSKAKELLSKRVSRRGLLNGAAAVLFGGGIGESVDIYHKQKQLEPYIKKAHEDAQSSPAYPPDYSQQMENQLYNQDHIYERMLGSFLAFSSGILLFDRVNTKKISRETTTESQDTKPVSQQKVTPFKS